MDPLSEPANLIAFSLWLLFLVLNTPEAPAIPHLLESADDGEGSLKVIAESVHSTITEAQNQLRSTLLQFRLCTTYNFLDEDLGFWFKPRSTTWFSRFLLEQYDNSHWVQMFRMTKPAVLALADVLRPQVQKENTKYRLAIPVLIRVVCTLFKLIHGANTTVCSELFAIGRSLVFVVLREVVNAINVSLRHELVWPTGDRLRDTKSKFYQLCGLPGVVGAIDGMHIAISKPHYVPSDYYYFKSGGYTLNCQAVVDSDKRFLDLYLGMPGSTNDSRMLRRSSLYSLGMQNTLMGGVQNIRGFTPYLVGDLGYPLLPWLMVPHKTPGQLSVSENLFNRRLRRGRCVVENAFGILNESFRELLLKSELHVTFLPDVILCCVILHNILVGQSHEQVEELPQVLRSEGFNGVDNHEDLAAVEGVEGIRDDTAAAVGSQKRQELGIFLTTLRRPQP